MDGVRLLADAQAAGLRVETAGKQVVVRGPKRLEPLARQLLDHKPTVTVALSLPESARVAILHLHPASRAALLRQWGGSVDGLADSETLPLALAVSLRSAGQSAGLSERQTDRLIVEALDAWPLRPREMGWAGGVLERLHRYVEPSAKTKKIRPPTVTPTLFGESEL